MSEPVDLTGMTPQEARRAVRVASRTMELRKPSQLSPTPTKKSATKPTGATPVTAKPKR